MNEKDAKLLMDTILTAAILGSANEKAKEEKTSKTEREAAKELVKPLYEAYLGFQDAGFTPEQAFQLLLAMKD